MSQVQLDLSQSPAIFVSATHLTLDELHNIEASITDADGTLTYDVNEAEIVLSKVTKKTRILFDLRGQGLVLCENDPSKIVIGESVPLPQITSTTIDRKRKRSPVRELGIRSSSPINLDESETDDGKDSPAVKDINILRQKFSSVHGNDPPKSPGQHVSDVRPATVSLQIVRPEWLTESLRQGCALPLKPYISLSAVFKQLAPYTDQPEIRNFGPLVKRPSEATFGPSEVVDSAKKQTRDHTHADTAFSSSKTGRYGHRRFGRDARTSQAASWQAGQATDNQFAYLLQQTTTEHDIGYSSDLPEMPAWVKAGIRYSCMRVTLAHGPNTAFIALLKEIQQARLLTNDEVGVRAYATSTAAIAAYPYKIGSPREILALPGCDTKIANLFVEWSNTGKIKAVEDLAQDEDLKSLRLFYDIWGVGATTAREFYYDKGWRDLDDIVEYGWSTLSRVQQIGVKYYDEFLDLIPRTEIEGICAIIHRHAVTVRDDGIQSIIVGGYRRGKEACGDVDIILSHPDERQTLNLVTDVVASLEGEGWITHTLLLSLNNTNRDQQTLPFRSLRGGHGFDTLDKALVVWQDPSWPTKAQDLLHNAKAKNPNIHRRVDIIIAPWRTVGCAIVGWSGGTTFERDLRSYARNKKGWKFDSSGVRDRSNGGVMDLEGYFSYRGVSGEVQRAKTMAEAEKRVFEGFDLPFLEPWERVTG